MRTTLDLTKADNKKILMALQTIEKIFSSRAITSSDASNFIGSANRVARMYRELYWEKEDIQNEVIEGLLTSFPVSSGIEFDTSNNEISAEDGMVTHGPIILNSMCPHHFMPVRYHSYIAYIPSNTSSILGTSKLDRIPEALSHRFILQEQLAKDIADIFYFPLKTTLLENVEKAQQISFESDGSICTLIGVHTCEACRGVKQDARTMVTERRGSFRDSSLEQRFYSQIGILDRVKPF